MAIANPTAAGPRRVVRGGAGRRCRGVVLVITLLAVILIAAMVFYVFNLGRSFQTRIETQNAADAAAAAGAGWIARSLNAVAMNNVEMSRMIAMVNVLDATDESLHPAYHEAFQLHASLTGQKPGAGGRITVAEAAVIGAQMNPIILDYEHELDEFEPLKRIFAAPEQPEEYASPSGALDVSGYTFYDGPSGRGRIWRAMVALDELSQAVMENHGALAQLSAEQVGTVNLDAAGSGAVLVPLLPEIPWRRGRFDDFQRPVELGLLPLAVDDREANRGPYDTIFGWRRRNREPAEELVREGIWQDGGSGFRGPGGIGPEGHWETPPVMRWINTGYRVYGPQSWMLDDLRYAHLSQSRFYWWRSRVAQIKLDYLFHDTRITDFPWPIWKIEWGEVSGIADRGEDRSGKNRTIRATRFFVTRIKSEVPRSAGGYLRLGTFSVGTPGRIIQLGGDWQSPLGPGGWGNDPRRWPSVAASGLVGAVSVKRIADSAWRFESRLKTPDGDLIWQYHYYFCLGVDVGEPVDIRNPHNFTDRGSLPAPIDLEHELLGPQNPSARRDHLTYLAIARRSSRSVFWSRKFDPPADSIYPYQVALAQARVFNNHSHDLWTQMWHAQLEPIDGYGDWLDRFDVTDGDAVPVLNPGELAELRQYLGSVEPLAGVMLNH